MNIIDTLKSSMPLLTGKQQHIASYMINNANEMCFITLKDFSQQVGCTEATAIRFCQKIGYESFTDAKNAFRMILAESNYDSLAAESTDSGLSGTPFAKTEDYITTQIEQEKEYVMKQLENMPIGELNSMAEAIVKADSVYIIGRGSSYSVADFMRRRLSLFGIRVFLINPDEMTALQSALNKVSVNDVFIFITFPMYYLPIINIARYVKEHGATTIGFTDSMDSLLVKHCHHYLLMGEMKKNHIYSCASLMMLFNILLSIIQLKTNDANLMDFKNVLEEISHPDYQGSDYQALMPIDKE